MNPSAASAESPIDLIDPTHMHDPACYMCGSRDRRVRFNEHMIDLVECSSCGFVYVTPQLDEEGLKALYQDAYWQSARAKDYGYTNYLNDAELYLKTFKKRIKNITAHRDGGRLLDVGCAAGFFLKVAKDHGFEIHGIDVAVPMLTYARETLGLENIQEGFLEHAGFPDKHFDVITLWDVIEHLPDPLHVLKETRRLIKDDGLLVLETQNVRSRFAKVMGKKWHHYKMLEHIYHFDPGTCTTLLERAGYDVIRWTGRRAGKYVSMGFIHERSQRLGKWAQRIATPLRLVAGAALYVNPFDEMVLIAKPKNN